jgi:RES domain-containing protein
MKIFRIADGRHPLWSGTGAMLVGGRWNSPGKPVIYGSFSFAGAMLEVLVHARIGRLPQTHVYVVADVPNEIAIERLDKTQLAAGWSADGNRLTRALGDQWFKQASSAVLLVPSVVAREEWNAIVNPAHPDAVKITVSSSRPVIWDERLFRDGTSPEVHESRSSWSEASTR